MEEKAKTPLPKQRCARIFTGSAAKDLERDREIREVRAKVAAQETLLDMQGFQRNMSVENLSEANKVTLFKLLQAMTNDALKKDTKKAEKVD